MKVCGTCRATVLLCESRSSESSDVVRSAPYAARMDMMNALLSLSVDRSWFLQMKWSLVAMT
eukprot:5340436-Heterocapsa_arctica.AAC.1